MDIVTILFLGYQFIFWTALYIDAKFLDSTLFWAFVMNFELKSLTVFYFTTILSIPAWLIYAAINFIYL